MFLGVLIILVAVSAVVFVLPKRFKYLGLASVVGIGAVAAITEALKVLISGAKAYYGSYWTIMFGTEFMQMDQVSALFMIVISVCAIGVLIYSKEYIEDHLEQKSAMHLSVHMFSFAVLFFSMLFILIARGGFGFLFAWEVMSLTSFMLLVFDSDRTEVRKTALNYLVLMHIGFVLLLVGFVTISSQGLPVSFDSLSAYFVAHKAIPLFIIFLIGFGIKAGLFPLHAWMPQTYHSAPDHISAFMSGAVSKMGIYGIIRVVLSMPEEQLRTVGIILLSVGAVTGLWGIIFATLQKDIKRLLAYSSIENIGIIILAMGVGVIGASAGNSLLLLCGIGGALLHVINHSLFKSLLFMASGNIRSRMGTSRLDAMGGLAKRMPLTGIIFLIGCLAICAMPPFNGFVSEFMIYFGLMDTISTNTDAVLASVCAILALALIGGIAVLAFTKLYGVVFQGTARSAKVEEAREVGWWRIGACAIPLAGILAVAAMPVFFSRVVFQVVGQTMHVENIDNYLSVLRPNMIAIAYVAGILVALTALLFLFKAFLQRLRYVEKGEVWNCGYPETTSRMQYSGESYSQGLHYITSPISKTSGKGGNIPKSNLFPEPTSFKTSHKDKIDLLFNAWWVELLRIINKRVMSLRTGRVNYYILYALVFLVLILILSLMKII